MCWKMGSIPQNVDLDKLKGYIRILGSYPHLHHLKPINKSWTHGERGEETDDQIRRYSAELRNERGSKEDQSAAASDQSM